jgi:uncharacterized membrane protein YcgQ (UPF0703/DUF1980 family)
VLLTSCAEQPKGNIGGNQNGTQSNSAEQSAKGQQSDGSRDIKVQPFEDRADQVVEITEKMFVAQSNDIYYNYNEYVGKTIKYEGIFSVYVNPENNRTYYSVIRYGPGCCGVDANCGLEVLWADGEEHTYPQENDWCAVEGVLIEYQEDARKYLRLNLTSLKVLETRGKERVTQ